MTSTPTLQTRIDRWRAFTHRRLSHVFESVQRLAADDTSRMVFFSDCHRGDGGPTDDLWPNRALYLYVLTYYYQQGYTYVEVGDGDELWKNRRLAPIQRAHRPIYDLLHAFDQQGRLHLIMGNHDHATPRLRVIVKEGMPASKGLVLQHRESGQEILVTHGHQADFEKEPGLLFSRLGVRYFWRFLQKRGYWRNPNWGEIAQGPSRLGRAIARGMVSRNERVEARLKSWLRPDGPALLCGHTHVARFAAPGQAAYFNTGCCIVPGQLTGLELDEGGLSPVRWTENGSITREQLAPTRPLANLSVS
jgi:UDP-2,3-diacylglucosamine pyrophosphatase LpxH